MKKQIELTIKIEAGDSAWPEQYRGKTVAVKVDAVYFPDNTFWNVNGLAVEDYFVEGGVKTEEKKGLPALLGQELKTLNVEFK